MSTWASGICIEFFPQTRNTFSAEHHETHFHIPQQTLLGNKPLPVCYWPIKGDKTSESCHEPCEDEKAAADTEKCNLKLESF